MSDRTNVPARLRIVLLAGLAGVLMTVLCLFGAAEWMTSRRCSGMAAVPLATASLGIGSFCSGWLAAFLQKKRGLLCGAEQGLLFVLLLIALNLPSGLVLENTLLLRVVAAILCGCLGGALGIRCHTPKRSGG